MAEEKHKAERENAEKPKLKEMVRILNTDIPGEANIYYGLTRVKGISWNLSNVVCHIINLERTRKVGSLNDSEVSKIEETIKNLHTQKIPTFILNRPRTDKGEARHLTGTDLELQTKMDIKKLREIQSYRGIRHALGLPVRGQRTRSHHRHGKTIGVVKKKQKQKVGTKVAAPTKK